MKTLVLANQKGGVGKSAVATLLAHYLAQHGQRVLAIDLDHQGNFSKPLRLSGRAISAPITADLLLTTAVTTMPQGQLVLVPSDRALLGLERQPTLHTPFARNLRAFLLAVDRHFDVCIVDTNPNPDIRVIAALASADFVLSPIQLNQEAMDGVSGLLNHERVGVRKIKAVLNPKLQLIGLLPTLVEPTPFQKATRARRSLGCSPTFDDAAQPDRSARRGRSHRHHRRGSCPGRTGLRSGRGWWHAPRSRGHTADVVGLLRGLTFPLNCPPRGQASRSGLTRIHRRSAHEAGFLASALSAWNWALVR
jgi:cellulose biosynthesis protein BcsQ